MATAILNAARLRELLDYDSKTGFFSWKERSASHIPNEKARRVWNICHAGKPAQHKARGYIGIRVEGRSYFAHRLAWLMIAGVWPSGVIDHRNGDTTDNRIDNLRDVTDRINAENRRFARAGAASGMLGAQWNKRLGSWQSAICVRGERKHLGLFDTAIMAHEAYLLAKRKLHEGCTI